MNPHVIHQIKFILAKYLSPQDRVFIFGSRAAGTARKWSDIDIGILPSGPVFISAVKEEFVESDIPYRVDVVNFNKVTPEFKQVALFKTIPL